MSNNSKEDRRGKKDIYRCLHRPWLQVALSRINVATQQTLSNQRMSAVREAIKWSYKVIKQLWSLQDYKRNLKVRKAPISQVYKSAAILKNIKTCLHCRVSF